MKECYVFDVDGTTLYTPKVINNFVDKKLLKYDPFENINCFKKYDDYISFYKSYIKLCLKNSNYRHDFSELKNCDIFLLTRFSEKRTSDLEMLAKIINAKDLFELANYNDPTSKLTFSIDVMNILNTKFKYTVFNYYDDEISNCISLLNKTHLLNYQVKYNLIVYPYLDNDKEVVYNIMKSKININFIPYYTWF